MKGIVCFFLGHKICAIRRVNIFFTEKVVRKCARCGAEFGVPFFENPPPPPPKKKVAI